VIVAAHRTYFSSYALAESVETTPANAKAFERGERSGYGVAIERLRG
jgi:hypothetical protein